MSQPSIMSKREIRPPVHRVGVTLCLSQARQVHACMKAQCQQGPLIRSLLNANNFTRRKEEKNPTVSQIPSLSGKLMTHG